MLRVNGQVLIERQIKQLLKRGITDITVVVGYKKEYFFYLEDKYGVAHRCESDQYAAQQQQLVALGSCANQLWPTPTSAPRTTTSSRTPSSAYVWKAPTTPSNFAEGPTDEWCVDDRRRTTASSDVTPWAGTTPGSCSAMPTLIEAFSERFVALLDAVARQPRERRTSSGRRSSSSTSDELRHGDPPLRAGRHPRVRLPRRAAGVRPASSWRTWTPRSSTTSWRPRLLTRARSATSTRSSRGSRTSRATLPSDDGRVRLPPSRRGDRAT